MARGPTSARRFGAHAHLGGPVIITGSQTSKYRQHGHREPKNDAYRVPHDKPPKNAKITPLPSEALPIRYVSRQTLPIEPRFSHMPYRRRSKHCDVRHRK
jgi:hypothetical protein